MITGLNLMNPILYISEIVDKCAYDIRIRKIVHKITPLWLLRWKFFSVRGWNHPTVRKAYSMPSFCRFFFFNSASSIPRKSGSAQTILNQDWKMMTDWRIALFRAVHLSTGLFNSLQFLHNSECFRNWHNYKKVGSPITLQRKLTWINSWFLFPMRQISPMIS